MFFNVVNVYLYVLRCRVQRQYVCLVEINGRKTESDESGSVIVNTTKTVDLSLTIHK